MALSTYNFLAILRLIPEPEEEEVDPDVEPDDEEVPARPNAVFGAATFPVGTDPKAGAVAVTADPKLVAKALGETLDPVAIGPEPAPVTVKVGKDPKPVPVAPDPPVAAAVPSPSEGETLVGEEPLIAAVPSESETKAPVLQL